MEQSGRSYYKIVITKDTSQHCRFEISLVNTASINLTKWWELLKDSNLLSKYCNVLGRIHNTFLSLQLAIEPNNLEGFFSHLVSVSTIQSHLVSLSFLHGTLTSQHESVGYSKDLEVPRPSAMPTLSITIRTITIRSIITLNSECCYSECHLH